MPSSFTLSLSGNYKFTFSNHRKWGGAVVGNGESWPRFYPNTATVAADVVRLGIIPTFSLTAPTTTVSGTSTANTYGIAIVYRAANYDDGLSGDDIQSNRSNIVDVTLAANQAAVLTKVTTSDAKVDAIDIYAALKTSGVYNTFYRVVSGCANSAGTVTFNILMAGGFPTGGATSEGTVDATGKVLATDNDFPTARPFNVMMDGRNVSFGGITKRVTATFTNGNGTVTTAETVYDGIEFWFLKRDSDTSGGVDGRGTYLCRYATSTTVTLVNADGTADTYDGSSGSGTATIWQQPNRGYSKLYNPHAEPADNVSDDYPGALLAGGAVPNTNRLLLMGRDFVVAEDYDQLPLTQGLNTISNQYGCSSHFSVVAARGKLYWLDLGKNRREIVSSDGTSVVPISTRKIKSILSRVTLDMNGDVWRVGFIPGAYIQEEGVIRWGLYLDNNTVSNFNLELDLETGDVRGDPQFYSHRYLDVFTYGSIRGRTFIGQYGWTGGVARIGQDNVLSRYRDWVEGGTLSGTLATSGQTVSVLTIASGTLYTTGDGLKGIQALVWREKDASGNLIVNPTYYHCRISANTSSAFTVNYVETVNSVGRVTDVASELPSAPSGSGWRFAVGVIQAMIGPKWISAEDGRAPVTLKEIAVTHRGQDLTPDTQSPVRVHFFENFDTTARDSRYLDPSREGQQLTSTAKYGGSAVGGGTNPCRVAGFSIVDNNVNTDTVALDIETITLDVQTQEN